MINGIGPDNFAGGSVSAAGDVNGDGIDDVIIGAHRTDSGGNPYAGASYVVFGNAQSFGASLELSSLDGSNGFVIRGVDAEDRSGFSVGAAGEVNGDGIDDVIIGAYGASSGGNPYAGASYVVFGKTRGFAPGLDLSTLDGGNGFVITGIDAWDQVGHSVSAAGDVNGDGIDDVIIGSSSSGNDYAGQSYIVFGNDRIFSGTFESAASPPMQNLAAVDKAVFPGTLVRLLAIY